MLRGIVPTGCIVVAVSIEVVHAAQHTCLDPLGVEQVDPGLDVAPGHGDFITQD